MIPRDFIDRLNEDADIAALVGERVALKGNGGRLKGLCPFHDEKTPSFSVNPAKGLYYCFGCQAKGNALRFLMDTAHGGDFLAAVHDLAARQGKDVPSDGRDAAKQAGDRGRKGLVERQAATYHKALFRTTGARSHLKDRGIGKDTARRFMLGYAAKDGGLPDAGAKELREAGLVSEKGKPYFRDRLMFPVRDRLGNAVGFAGRVLDGGREPKYLNSPQSSIFDKSRLVYGLAENAKGITEAGHALVVEGYMDVVSLAEEGVDNAVACMGTAVTTEQIRAIYAKTRHVRFCLDGDEAGAAAARKMLARLMPVLTAERAADVVRLPGNEDPSSYVYGNGADAFRGLAANTARPYESLLLDPDFLNGGPVRGMTDRIAAWKRAVELADMVPGEEAALRGFLLKDIRRASGMGLDALRSSSSSNGGEWPQPTDSEMQMLACVHLRPRLARHVLARGGTGPYAELAKDLAYELEDGHGDATLLGIAEGRSIDPLLEDVARKAAALKAAGVDPGARIWECLE